MGVRWVMTQVMMAVMGKAIMASATAATIPLATAQSAIWATPATLATIATFGAAAAAAPAFVLSAEAITLASSMFAEGGYTGGGGKYDVAGVRASRRVCLPAIRRGPHWGGQPGRAPSRHRFTGARWLLGRAGPQGQPALL